MADPEHDDLAWLQDHGYDPGAVADALAWFADRGWNVEVVPRDRREEMRARGEVYLPGYRHGLWVDLVRVGQEKATATNYASGNTKAEAIIPSTPAIRFRAGVGRADRAPRSAAHPITSQPRPPAR